MLEKRSQPMLLKCNWQASNLATKYGAPEEVTTEQDTVYFWHDGPNVTILSVPVNSDWGTLRVTPSELTQLEASVES